MNSEVGARVSLGGQITFVMVIPTMHPALHYHSITITLKEREEGNRAHKVSDSSQEVSSDVRSCNLYPIRNHNKQKQHQYCYPPVGVCQLVFDPEVKWKGNNFNQININTFVVGRFVFCGNMGGLGGVSSVNT